LEKSFRRDSTIFRKYETKYLEKKAYNEHVESIFLSDEMKKTKKEEIEGQTLTKTFVLIEKRSNSMVNHIEFYLSFKSILSENFEVVELLASLMHNNYVSQNV
jgi:hypothetical protein